MTGGAGERCGHCGAALSHPAISTASWLRADRAAARAHTREAQDTQKYRMYRLWACADVTCAHCVHGRAERAKEALAALGGVRVGHPSTQLGPRSTGARTHANISLESLECAVRVFDATRPVGAATGGCGLCGRAYKHPVEERSSLKPGVYTS